MNLLFVLGGVATIAKDSPVAVSGQVMNFLVPVMVGYSLALVVVMRTGWRVTRLEGALLLASYGVFAVAAY
jgi:cation:H+ antiporter